LQGTRFEALDGMRGYAVLAVVLMHARWTPGGGYGVTVFFVLSGFLIAYLLLNEQERYGKINISDFYKRRVVRLVPALYFMFAVVAIWSILLAPEPFGIASAWGMIYGIFYFSNWAAAFPDLFPFGWLGTLAHTWTLAVEAQFYILFPLIFLFFRRFSYAVSACVLFMAFILACLYRIFMYKNGVSLAYLVNATDVNSSGLILGVSLAYAVKAWGGWNPPSIVSIPCLAVFIVTTIIYVPWFIDPGTAVKGLVEMGTALSIWSLLNPGAVAKVFFCNPVIMFIGRISYSLYLWHFPVFIALEQGHYMDGIALEVTKGTLSLVAAVLSYYFVERPALSWWRRRSASDGRARRSAAALVQQR